MDVFFGRGHRRLCRLWRRPSQRSSSESHESFNGRYGWGGNLLGILPWHSLCQWVVCHLFGRAVPWAQKQRLWVDSYQSATDTWGAINNAITGKVHSKAILYTFLCWQWQNDMWDDQRLRVGFIYVRVFHEAHADVFRKRSIQLRDD